MIDSYVSIHWCFIVILMIYQLPHILNAKNLKEIDDIFIYLAKLIIVESVYRVTLQKWSSRTLTICNLQDLNLKHCERDPHTHVENNTCVHI